MDPVLLARIQFAVTIGFHYIFPPITLGLTMLISIFLGLHLKTKNKLYDKIAAFWINVLVVVFSIGVATGIVMEFQFGTNWEKYSRFVGDIFGAPLAAEGIFSFFLESTFLGVLVLGKKRVSQGMYFFSSLMVTVGSTLSGFWIIAANSWQQTPAGYHIVNGRAELTNFFEAVFNPSTLPRFGHAIMGGWITGGFFVAGLSAYFLLKNQHVKFAKKSILVALSFALVSSLIQVEIGHIHATQVAKNQPEKMATYEAMFKSQSHAPMVIFGLPNETEQRIDYEISIPGLLSFMVGNEPDKVMLGLDAFKKELLPPLLLPFFTYRTMVGLGFYFILLAALGLFFYKKDTLQKQSWYLKILICSIPLPVIANEVGWMSAEVGRQPWIVWHELKTADAISTVVSANEILFSLIMFSVLYCGLFALFIFLLRKKMRQGPDVVHEAY